MNTHKKSDVLLHIFERQKMAKNAINSKRKLPYIATGKTRLVVHVVAGKSLFLHVLAIIIITPSGFHCAGHD